MWKSKEIKLVDCCDCCFFTPNPIGDGFGIGRCEKLEEYKKKGASPKSVESAFKALGGKLFWGGVGSNRACGKYKTNLRGN